jgi:hypothetical protein
MVKIVVLSAIVLVLIFWYRSIADRKIRCVKWCLKLMLVCDLDCLLYIPKSPNHVGAPREK